MSRPRRRRKAGGGCATRRRAPKSGRRAPESGTAAAAVSGRPREPASRNRLQAAPVRRAPKARRTGAVAAAAAAAAAASSGRGLRASRYRLMKEAGRAHMQHMQPLGRDPRSSPGGRAEAPSNTLKAVGLAWRALAILFSTGEERLRPRRRLLTLGGSDRDRRSAPPPTTKRSGTRRSSPVRSRAALATSPLVCHPGSRSSRPPRPSRLLNRRRQHPPPPPQPRHPLSPPRLSMRRWCALLPTCLQPAWPPRL